MERQTRRVNLVNRNVDMHVVRVVVAALLQDTNRLTEAEPLYRRALAIDERSFGPDHSKVARDLSNLAGLYYTQRQCAKAEPLMRRALEIDEKCYGPKRPRVAADLNNLAVLYHSQGDYAKTEPLYERALAIREQTLCPEHREAVSLSAT